jgi:hypothetical protein
MGVAGQGKRLPRALEAMRGGPGKPTTSGADNVTDLVQRRKEINQEHDRIINEIRMRVTDDLMDAETASRVAEIDPDSVHKIGDRFVSDDAHFEIKKYDYVTPEGVVNYRVEKTFPDGRKITMTLNNKSLSYTKKMGGFEVVKPTTSGPK